MAERPDAEPEGWGVPQRWPMIAALAVPLGLLALLALAGRLYMIGLAPHHPPVTSFPAPGVESHVHAGVEDPELPARRAPRDPALAAAKAAVVAQGLSGWPGR